MIESVEVYHLVFRDHWLRALELTVNVALDCLDQVSHCHFLFKVCIDGKQKPIVKNNATNT